MIINLKFMNFHQLYDIILCSILKYVIPTIFVSLYLFLRWAFFPLFSLFDQVCSYPKMNGWEQFS